jgi:hypothetical protein
MKNKDKFIIFWKIKLSHVINHKLNTAFYEFTKCLINNKLSVLRFDWLLSGWQNHLYVKMLYQGFYYSEWCQKILHCLQVRRFRLPISHPDDVSSRPNAHLSTFPSVRTTCHTVWTPQQIKHHLSGRRAFLSGPSLFWEATVPACISLDVSASRLDASQWSIRFRFFPSSI